MLGCGVGEANTFAAAFLIHDVLVGKDLRLAAIFDSDPEKVGTKLCGLLIEDVSRITKVVPKLGAKIGVVTGRANATSNVIGLLERSGVRAILNLAPATVLPGKNQIVVNADLAKEIDKLCCRLSTSQT